MMQESESTTKPVTCWRYALPSVQHQGWAVVHADSHGFFGVVSDFGNYAFNWTAFGDNFRRFLLEMEDDTDYLCSKLGSRTYFSRRETAQAFREHILDYRRNGYYDKDTAQDLWRTVNAFVADDREAEWLVDHTSGKLPDGWEMLRYDYDPRLRGFAQHIWPRSAPSWTRRRHPPNAPHGVPTTTHSARYGNYSPKGHRSCSSSIRR